jgi:cation diffusion facilitator CzcD-associated flavoprotein CzcO
LIGGEELKMADDLPEREAMEFDVVIVGGGPAGLSAAIRLKQLNPDLAARSAPTSSPVPSWNHAP